MSVPAIFRRPESTAPPVITPMGSRPDGDTWPCWPLPVPRPPRDNGSAPAILVR